MSRDLGVIVEEIQYHQNKINKLRMEQAVAPVNVRATLIDDSCRLHGRELHIRMMPGRTIRQRIVTQLDANALKKALEDHRFIDLVIEIDGPEQ